MDKKGIKTIKERPESEGPRQIKQMARNMKML